MNKRELKFAGINRLGYHWTTTFLFSYLAALGFFLSSNRFGIQLKDDS